MPLKVTVTGTPKYNENDITAPQKTKLQEAIGIFLADKTTDLAKVTPTTPQPFTLLGFQFPNDNTKLAVDFAVTKYEKKDPTDEVEVQVDSLAPPTVSAPVPALNVLSGAEELVDLDMEGKDVHVGIAVGLKSGAGTSVLTIPDVTKVGAGKSPIYITKPITLELKKLQKFLTKKGVTLPSALDGLLNDTTLSCDALYIKTNNGPLLMMFQVQFTKGLIASLTNDPDIGDLFDITGVAVRVFRCSKENFPVLQNYAAELREEQKELTESE
jgi:hypothetical protein